MAGMAQWPRREGEVWDWDRGGVREKMEKNVEKFSYAHIACFCFLFLFFLTCYQKNTISSHFLPVFLMQSFG